MMQGQKAAAKNMAVGHHVDEPGYPSESSLNGRPTPKLNVAATLRNAAWAESHADTDCGFMDKQILELKAIQDEQLSLLENSFEHHFNLGMGGVIVANVVWIAIEVDFGPDEGTAPGDRIFWMFMSTLFLLTFSMEIGVRLHWERSRWIFGFWNWFDLSVVLCGIVDVWILTFIEGSVTSMQALTALRMARLIRLVRMIKLVRNLHSVYVIVMAFMNAFASMVVLGGMMIFGMLIYAIFATMLIGKNAAFDDVRIMGDTVDDRFGKVYRSMYSLFELMTLEGWEQVARPLVEKQPLVFLFIGSFIMIFTYGMLNMVVATVVEKTLDQSNMMKTLDGKHEMLMIMGELHCMKDLFHQDAGQDAGEKASAVITCEEFEAAMTTNEPMRTSLEAMGIPTRNARELFNVLDMDGDMQVTIQELISGVAKIQGNQASPWDVLSTRAGVNVLRKQMTPLIEQVGALVKLVRSTSRSCDGIEPPSSPSPKLYSPILAYAPPEEALHKQISVLAQKQADFQQSAEARFQAQDQTLQEILRHVRIMSLTQDLTLRKISPEHVVSDGKYPEGEDEQDLLDA